MVVHVMIIVVISRHKIRWWQPATTRSARSVGEDVVVKRPIHAQMAHSNALKNGPHRALYGLVIVHVDVLQSIIKRNFLLRRGSELDGSASARIQREWIAVWIRKATLEGLSPQDSGIVRHGWLRVRRRLKYFHDRVTNTTMRRVAANCCAKCGARVLSAKCVRGFPPPDANAHLARKRARVRVRAGRALARERTGRALARATLRQ